MIASLETPVSSVTALAERCCREAGTTLAAILSIAPRQRSFALRLAVDDVVYRMKHSERPPSFAEIAPVLGYGGHSPAYDAYQRAAKLRAKEERHAVYTVGMGEIAGLDDTPTRRPLYDDGDDVLDWRGTSEGSVATRFKAKKPTADVANGVKSG